MANYYLDTEFLEGTQKKTFLGINVGETKPTIDLISIGIVSEDGREYYAISKDFNIKEAWNRFDLKAMRVYGADGVYVEEYWIRENVLKPIFEELTFKEFMSEGNGNVWELFKEEPAIYDFNKWKEHTIEFSYTFCFGEFKRLVNKYGKSNSEIAEEIKDFVYKTGTTGAWDMEEFKKQGRSLDFYAYYADYDWVAFCWLFGKMMDLPKGFPMYCRDLQQEFDNKIDTIDVFKAAKLAGYNQREIEEMYNYSHGNNVIPNVELLIKGMHSYPKQDNEHNALDDARWNMKLHKFINQIKN